MAYPIIYKPAATPSHLRIKWRRSRCNWMSYGQFIFVIAIDINSDNPDAIAQFKRQLEPILKHACARQVGISVESNHLSGENRKRLERIARRAIMRYFWRYGRCDLRVTMTN